MTMQTLAVRYAAQKTGQTINTALGHSNLDYHGEKIDALHDQNNPCRNITQVISNETLTSGMTCSVYLHTLAPFVYAFHQAFSVYPQQEQQ